MQIEKLKTKNLSAFLISLIMFFAVANSALAHVVVRPNQVGAAAFQTFTIGVPVEKDIATTGVRLVIPEGLHHVTPNVKPGWTIAVARSGEGEEATVTEISWMGGSIPPGQRDEFLFSAQVPAEETTLQWKAYQSYADGSVVEWDQDPNAEQPEDDHGHADFSETGPFSQTVVVDDLSAFDESESDSASKTEEPSDVADASTNTPMILSVIALIVSAAALWMQMRKR
jgi:uncharacterized protein YcnI